MKTRQTLFRSVVTSVGQAVRHSLWTGGSIEHSIREYVRSSVFDSVRSSVFDPVKISERTLEDSVGSFSRESITNKRLDWL